MNQIQNTGNAIESRHMFRLFDVFSILDISDLNLTCDSSYLRWVDFSYIYSTVRDPFSTHIKDDLEKYSFSS